MVCLFVNNDAQAKVPRALARGSRTHHQRGCVDRYARWRRLHRGTRKVQQQICLPVITSAMRGPGDESLVPPSLHAKIIGSARSETL